MSIGQLALRFLLEYVFSFVLTLPGFVTFMTGVLLFVALPIIPKTTGEFKAFANLHGYLSTSMLRRFAIVVSEHNDLLLKRMSFDDLGVEKISFSDVTKEFEDPAGTLHYWMDLPFALAWEEDGVLFDPRFAAAGARKKDAEDRGMNTVPATDDEWEQYGVHAWKKGLYELPEGVHELVDLSQIRHLIDGGERAEFPHRTEKLYELSRKPFQSGAGSMKIILVLLALIGPFAAMWLIASKLSSGQASSGTTVGFGSLLWVLAGLGPLRSVNWRRLAAVTGLVAAFVGAVLAVVALTGPVFAAFVFISIGAGFWFLPILSIVVRPISLFAGPFGSFLFKLFLLGYEKPVLEWTPEKYRLREYADLDDVDQDTVTWYNLEGSLFGFTFDPRPASWGAELADTSELEAKREVVADGGEPIGAESEIPAGHSRVPSFRRADVYAAFVPNDFDDDSYYLNTGIANGRFKDSANGERSLNRLLYAKEVHGDDTSISDTKLLYAVAGSGALSLLLGVVVFFIL